MFVTYARLQRAIGCPLLYSPGSAAHANKRKPNVNEDCCDTGSCVWAVASGVGCRPADGMLVQGKGKGAALDKGKGVVVSKGKGAAQAEQPAASTSGRQAP